MGRATASNLLALPCWCITLNPQSRARTILNSIVSKVEVPSDQRGMNRGGEFHTFSHIGTEPSLSNQVADVLPILGWLSSNRSGRKGHPLFFSVQAWLEFLSHRAGRMKGEFLDKIIQTFILLKSFCGFSEINVVCSEGYLQSLNHYRVFCCCSFVFGLFVLSNFHQFHWSGCP